MRRASVRVVTLVASLAALVGCAAGSDSSDRLASTSAASTTSAEAALSAPGAPAAMAQAAVAPTFTPCPAAAAAPSGWQCGTFTVPLVENDPSRGTIDLEVRLRRATAQPSLGPLFINTGGPGLPTADVATPVADAIPAAVRDRFDLVLMDPRGTLHSSATNCPTSPPGIEAAYEPLPEAADQAAVQTWLDKMSSANRACMAEIGTDLSQYGTWQTAADMDALRQALGAPTMSFLGYSYGTRLGAVYAERYPDRVRAMVLDSAVNPSGGNAEFGAGKAIAFNEYFRLWEAYCNQPTKQSCGVAGGPLPLYDAALAVAPFTDPSGRRWDRVAVESLVFKVISGSSTTSLDALPAALQRYLTGDAAPLAALEPQTAVPGGPDTSDPLVSINCADMSDRPDAAALSNIVTQARDHNLRGSSVGGFFAAECAGWPVGAKPVDNVSATTPNRIVVVGSQGDNYTAYRWSQQMAAATGGALISWAGFGHGVSFLRGSACVDNPVAAYLLDPSKVPADGTIC